MFNTNLLNSSLRMSYGRAGPASEAAPIPLVFPITPPPSVSGLVDSQVASRTAASEGTRYSSDFNSVDMVGVTSHLKRERVAETDLSSSPRTKARKRGAEVNSVGNGGGNVQNAAAMRMPGMPPTGVCFSDLGGMEGILHTVRQLIERPLRHPELYDYLGVQPPRGVLLHGPPGCGKTALANAIATEAGVPFLKVSAPEIVSGMSGESEAKVRGLFAHAAKIAPCIVFIDEIDAITQKREAMAQRGMESRIVAQLLTCMDDLGRRVNVVVDERVGESAQQGNRVQGHGHVVVIGATNRPDTIDPALRRAGRFDREIALGIPDEAARARIIRALCRKLRVHGSTDFVQIAKRTPGFVGADLAALTQEAASLALSRIFSSIEAGNFGGWIQGNGQNGAGEADQLLKTERSLALQLRKEPFTFQEMRNFFITMQDFEDAVSKVQPSARREGFSTLPDVTWDDVGSLKSVREELQDSICAPIKYPEEYEALGLSMAMGVLLYGPPGCGKTLVAKAIANDAGANFICIKGPELLNKYIGESERAVRLLFIRARASVPCVLFFDEMDAIAPKRGVGENQVAERVVNQLLIEMDGVDQRKKIYIIAATNRPDMIDPALLRPGRLDKLLYVPLPDQQGRVSILKTLTRTLPLTADTDIVSIAERCNGFSGADLAGLVREASSAVVRERREMRSGESMASRMGEWASPLQICQRHFDDAFTRVSPSVSVMDHKRYENLRMQLCHSRRMVPNPGPNRAPNVEST